MIDHFPGRVSGKLFGLRDQTSGTTGVVVRVHAAGRTIDQAAGRVEQGDRVGHLEADPLKAADLLAKSVPLVRVTGCHLQRRPPHADGPRRAGHPFWDHHAIKYLARPVLHANKVLGWHAGIAEDESSRPAAPSAQETVEILGLHARPLLDDKSADGLVGRGFGVGVGAGVDEEKVCLGRANDEPLLTAQEVVISLAAGLGGGPEKVRAAARFSERLGGDLFASQERPQPALFLLGRAKEVQRLADDAGHDVGAGERSAQHSHLLDGDDLVLPP